MNVVDVEMNGEPLRVEKLNNNLYNVVVADVIRHPEVDAEGVMRALANYIHGLSYQLEKKKTPKP